MKRWDLGSGTGLETPIYRNFDTDGVEISGGEAQKIALARALYRDTPFIILDEPTAALDPIAEAEIYAKFDEIAGDKTTIYISHRLSSCRLCDRILVFHEGRIVQSGTHRELLADDVACAGAVLCIESARTRRRREACPPPYSPKTYPS